MQRRIFFMTAILLFIALGAYTFIQRRQAVDANSYEKSQLNRVAASTTEAPTNDWRLILAEGQFHDVAHTGAGTATVYTTKGGRHFLQFTEFETAPADDLQVCLLASDVARDAATVKKAGFLSLAPLKEIIGDQTYELPANIDLNRYQAVAIVSRRLGLNFATAPLTRQ